MKLEVGMYVRTINGKIWIITSQKAISGHRKDIIKASYNIIDILEVGDYVNGQKVYYDKELDYLYVQSFDGDGNFYQTSITKKSFINNIKTIVTKESYSNVEYRVETD